MWPGGARRKRRYVKTNHRQTLPRTISIAGGGETKKSELQENTAAKARETKVKTLPQATTVAGGASQKPKTNTKWKSGPTHSPARGTEVPSRKRVAERKQYNVHHKEKK